MAKRVINNMKLGLFILGGLFFLVLLLYMIGKNRNMFGSNYVLKAKFENIQGLVVGNNVRFSGIQAGTVKKIKILNDTVIEVTMLIDTRMKRIIRTNAIVSIGTDGLVGNKVVNIIPSKEPAPLATTGNILVSKKAVDTEEMLQTLYKANNNVAIISDGLKTAIQRINSSKAVWTLLNDNSLPENLRRSAFNIRLATGKAGDMIKDLQGIVTGVMNGKGSVGALLIDSSFAKNLDTTALKIKAVGNEADSLINELNKMVAGIQQDINAGTGTVHALLKDSMIAIRLNASLDNIQNGTDGFNQNMEALKHNILFRGYFKKLERQRKKE